MHAYVFGCGLKCLNFGFCIVFRGSITGSARPICLAPVYLYLKTKINPPSAGYSEGVIRVAGEGPEEGGGGTEEARQEDRRSK